ncbi:MAG: putative rane protein [Candidatus Saccharibacteria bacterium]|nr:putative rane protein [Candidatus Saccharibacteria bacterium]
MEKITKPKKIILAAPSWAGFATGLLFWWASFTPSLLPRVWYLQAILTGISVAMGYGLGVVGGTAIGFFYHTFHWPKPSPAMQRVRWQLLSIAALFFGSLSLILSLRHQKELRQLMGMPPEFAFHGIYTALLAISLATLLIIFCRCVRGLNHYLDKRLNHIIPEPLAYVVSLLFVFTLLVGVIGQTGYSRLRSYANSAFRHRDAVIQKNLVAPAASEESGSRASVVAWNQLGKQGRAFVAGTTQPTQLESFSHKPSTQPIRVYAGLSTASTDMARAGVVLQELQRTKAFDRSIVCITTTTGTGWVDPDSPRALEYMYNGSVATAAMQYSYLPSWISFLTDRETAAQAGRALIETIHSYWSSLPVDHRPKLVIFGESLGAYGSQADFQTVKDIVARTDGVLWVGPPNASRLWEDLSQHRDNGTPFWLPVYQHGQTVRFAARPTDITRPSPIWPSPHALYLQYPSDPVVWWSPELLYKKPAWLNPPRGYDVSSEMQWYPVVSWVQMTVDLALAGNVPAGHGHVYNGDIYNAWAAISSPPGWTNQSTQQLRTYLGE